jgi:DNA ligase-1
MKTTYDTLYATDKNGKVKQWDICVENTGNHSLITSSFGYLDGKKTISKVVVDHGKNIGKRNETTHYEQAQSQAQSKWNKKRDIEGYHTTPTAHVLDSSEPAGPVLPMLAQDYSKHKKKLQFPCYVQPKLDGYRMIFNPQTKKCTTRTGKEYLIIKGTELYKQLLNLDDVDTCLDGELYVHDSVFKFENYGILRKQKELTKTEMDILNRIEYHVYDVIDEKVPFEERKTRLQDLQVSSNIKVVLPKVCNSETDIQEAHKEYVEEGYEGTMVRSQFGKYQCKYRSVDLLKYKDFDDTEYKIVDYTSEMDTTGNNEPLIVWICKTDNGKQFNVQSTGTREERKVLYKEADKYIGKPLWVKHFGLTADGIPRFPKTMRDGLLAIREHTL